MKGISFSTEQPTTRMSVFEQAVYAEGRYDLGEARQGTVTEGYVGTEKEWLGAWGRRQKRSLAGADSVLRFPSYFETLPCFCVESLFFFFFCHLWFLGKQCVCLWKSDERLQPFECRI